MQESPRVTLSNGITVANFSSPHPFNFTTGEILSGCNAERARLLMLESEEISVPNPKGWTDIDLRFAMSNGVMVELEQTCGRGDVDIVLVPLPVLQCIRQVASKSNDGWPLVTKKARCIRVADRVTKAIYPDRFCL